MEGGTLGHPDQSQVHSFKQIDPPMESVYLKTLHIYCAYRRSPPQVASQVMYFVLCMMVGQVDLFKSWVNSPWVGRKGSPAPPPRLLVIVWSLSLCILACSSGLYQKLSLQNFVVVAENGEGLLGRVVKMCKEETEDWSCRILATLDFRPAENLKQRLKTLSRLRERTLLEATVSSVCICAY